MDDGLVSTGVEINQLLPWGGRYAADWGSSRFTTTNLFNNYSPQLQANVALNYTQPLMRNFSIDQVRQQVQLSAKVRQLSDTQLQAVIVQTTRNVKNAYWDLTYAINNLAAQRQSLALAERSLHDNQRRVEVGTLAPIDIVQAQAEVAINEQNVIVAQASIKREEDRLRHVGDGLLQCTCLSRPVGEAQVRSFGRRHWHRCRARHRRNRKLGRDR